jgi:pimeloyl-ACP methyl ester carboxylesterase
MKSDSVLCLNTRGFHRVHYYDWGDDAAPVVICVHGLTRTGRDFDFLAESFGNRRRVVCPDVAGRGKSDWLPAKTDYNYVQYMNDLTALMARVTSEDRREVAWVGTSMGALLGILLASVPGSPITRLVVNDAGPLVPKAALARIADYVGKDIRFKTFAELDAYVRLVSKPFGALTDAQWMHLTTHSSRQFEDGRWGMAYDPGIAVAFQGKIEDVDLWAQWDAIKCPTLILRGAQSDLLIADTAAAMRQRGPKPNVVEIPDVGHAPMLMAEDQARIVREFLLA